MFQVLRVNEALLMFLFNFYIFLFGTSGQQCISTPRNTLTLPLDKRSSRAITDLCLLFTLKTLIFPHSEPFFRFLFHIYQLMTRISFSWIKEVNPLFLKKSLRSDSLPATKGYRWKHQLLNLFTVTNSHYHPTWKNKSKKNFASSDDSSLMFVLLVTISV